MSKTIEQRIPKGWRFYTADGSTEGNIRIVFIRDEAGRDMWHNLSGERQEVTDLYISGRGATFDEAFCIAVKDAKCAITPELIGVKQ